MTFDEFLGSTGYLHAGYLYSRDNNNNTFAQLFAHTKPGYLSDESPGINDHTTALAFIPFQQPDFHYKLDLGFERNDFVKLSDPFGADGLAGSGDELRSKKTWTKSVWLAQTNKAYDWSGRIKIDSLGTPLEADKYAYRYTYGWLERDQPVGAGNVHLRLGSLQPQWAQGLALNRAVKDPDATPGKFVEGFQADYTHGDFGLTALAGVEKDGSSTKGEDGTSRFDAEHSNLIGLQATQQISPRLKLSAGYARIYTPAALKKDYPTPDIQALPALSKSLTSIGVSFKSPHLTSLAEVALLQRDQLRDEADSWEERGLDGKGYYLEHNLHLSDRALLTVKNYDYKLLGQPFMSAKSMRSATRNKYAKANGSDRGNGFTLKYDVGALPTATSVSLDGVWGAATTYKDNYDGELVAADDNNPYSLLKLSVSEFGLGQLKLSPAVSWSRDYDATLGSSITKKSIGLEATRNLGRRKILTLSAGLDRYSDYDNDESEPIKPFHDLSYSANLSFLEGFVLNYTVTGNRNQLTALRGGTVGPAQRFQRENWRLFTATYKPFPRRDATGITRVFSRPEFTLRIGSEDGDPAFDGYSLDVTLNF